MVEKDPITFGDEACSGIAGWLESLPGGEHSEGLLNKGAACAGVGEACFSGVKGIMPLQ